jgi:aryl-alcohol dehydrogenase-like predicted oxidoreductase
MTNMEYRPLGHTGIQVSKLCLGTMMLGAWGNPDHDDSIRIIHAALDAGVRNPSQRFALSSSSSSRS